MYSKVVLTVVVGVGLLSSTLTSAIAQTRDTLAVDSATVELDTVELALMHRALSYAQIEQVVKAIALTPDYLPLIPCVLPVDLPLERFRVTSPFGLRKHPIYGRVRLHTGLDVKATTGQAIKATAAGIVKQVGYNAELGAFVRLQHAFGFETVYGHLSGYCVRVGQSVRCGEGIGRVGQTGAATGPHLHYTIKKNGSVIDPFQFCFLLRKKASVWLADSVTTPRLVQQPRPVPQKH
ncbi:peptidase M23-like protein [Spirosoma oryzae]|uniref:Peptidase M23-like protein n=1 Tax=Spirosoma oryzae TaxID=1469603 RepID=A0A2T0SNR8_9BACT|nr:peptidase M23-like protein [Spirosoma oryzae]